MDAQMWGLGPSVPIYPWDGSGVEKLGEQMGRNGDERRHVKQGKSCNASEPKWAQSPGFLSSLVRIEYAMPVTIYFNPPFFECVY